MLRLTTMLRACDIPLNLDSYKIHLATGDNWPPLEAFFDGKFKEWQENQKQKNFECAHVIGLIKLERDRWLFAGVYKLLGNELQPDGRYQYQTEILPRQDQLVGRLIVLHHRTARASYLWGAEDGGEFYVAELREKPLVIEEFPGYHAVTVSFSNLKIIISQNVASWRGALSNMSGVYLITDRSNGRLYVGSAVGDSGIWQRWSDYVNSGHGGNQELRSVLKDRGQDHVENFQYSILEIADPHAAEEAVLERESYWKHALQSREHGYNGN